MSRPCPVAPFCLSYLHVLHQQIGKKYRFLRSFFRKQFFSFFTKLDNPAFEIFNKLPDRLHQAVGGFDFPVQISDVGLNPSLFHLPDSSTLMDGRDNIKPLSFIRTEIHPLRAVVAEEAVFLPNLLMKYMEVRKAERSDWTRAGQNRGTSKDLKAVSEALSYLQRKGLSTVEDLENFIETSGKSAADYRKQMKPKETRSNVIDAILAARTDCKECKPVYEKYQKIFFKKTKEKFKLEHPEVARFEKASAYLAKHPDDKDSTKKELLQEQAKLVGEIADLKVPLTEVQEDLKKLRDIRYWVRKATPGTEESKEPPKKQPIKEVLQDKADEKKAQKNAPAQTKHKQQDMEL